MKIDQNSALVDTNLLVYLYIRDSFKAKLVKELIDRLSRNKTEIVLAEQSLLEFYSIVTDQRRIRKPATSITAAKEIQKFYQCRLFKIIYPNITTFSILLKILRHKTVKGGNIFDYYLAATALSYGIHLVCTENVKDFKEIKEIKTINPFV